MASSHTLGAVDAGATLASKIPAVAIHLFLRLSAISLLLVLNLAAQTNKVAQRLGYPADAKLLILHADDLAVTHSVTASHDSLNSGAVSSARVRYNR